MLTTLAFLPRMGPSNSSGGFGGPRSSLRCPVYSSVRQRFASIVEFNRSMIGPLLPPIDTLADWFCSDRMYWRPWPRHVAGWWEWAQQRDNVLFVHFEEMTNDFAGVRDRVLAGVLGTAWFVVSTMAQSSPRTSR